MSRTMKIVLGIGILGLVCCGIIVAMGGWVGMRVLQGMKTDPAEVKAVASTMADYTLPPGMKEVMSMDLLGMKAVMISSGDLNDANDINSMNIMMMQLPAGASSNDTEQMQEAMKNQMGRKTGQLTPMGEKTVTINGQPVTFQISESTTSKGAVRQMVGLFEGKGGQQVMLMIMGPSTGWDDAAADSFLASIH